MKMMIEAKSIVYFILVCALIKVTFETYTFNCVKELPIILDTYHCQITDIYDANCPEKLIAILPECKLSDNSFTAGVITEIIDIKSPLNFTLLINKSDTFQTLFPAARIISIHDIDSITFSEELKNTTIRLRQDLFNLPNLEKLSIPSAKLDNTQHTWKLPNQLTFLNFSNNRYTEYNLQKLRFLESVDFTNNSLTRLPSLYYPLRSLRELYLSGNPLNEVVTEDIAKLCALEKLTLKRTSFEKEERFCECEKLKRWISKVIVWSKFEDDKNLTEHVFGGQFNCNSQQIVSKSKLLKDCKKNLGSAWNLNEAFEQREYCLTGERPMMNSFNEN